MPVSRTSVIAMFLMQPRTELAFVMGLHPRLGIGSAVMLFTSEDVFWIVRHHLEGGTSMISDLDDQKTLMIQRRVR